MSCVIVASREPNRVCLSVDLLAFSALVGKCGTDEILSCMNTCSVPYRYDQVQLMSLSHVLAARSISSTEGPLVSLEEIVLDGGEWQIGESPVRARTSTSPFPNLMNLRE